MKRYVLIILCWFFTAEAYSWGQIGHRVTGKIAEIYLNNKARKKIRELLNGQTIYDVSNFMDEIRSVEKYRYMDPWHYCTIPDGQTYQQAGTPDEGDALVTIERLISELKSGNFTYEDEAFNLKCLIHLIGDIHQPLHVGRGDDRGGNDIKLTYFGESSNLHRVWDSGIIDGQKLSYSEYAEWINHPTKEEIIKWQSAKVSDWAYESMQCRDQVYRFPEDKKLSYRYNYDNINLVNERLLQAGIRLAGILNTLYG